MSESVSTGSRAEFLARTRLFLCSSGHFSGPTRIHSHVVEVCRLSKMVGLGVLLFSLEAPEQNIAVGSADLLDRLAASGFATSSSRYS